MEGLGLARWSMTCSLREFIASLCGRDDRNEDQWLCAAVEHTVNAASMSDYDAAWRNCLRLSVLLELVLA